MSSEHVEVLERLRGVLEHGKMGDKCLIAPDLVTAAIAALSAPQPPAEAQAVAWSTDKPKRPGVYGVRGFNLCRGPEEQFEAIVSVRLHQGDLICNLHEYTSEEDFDRWARVDDCNDGFEWCEFVPAHPPPSAPALPLPGDRGSVQALFNPQPPAEAQPCGCGEATCTVPWEPGCGLGKSEQHAVVQAQSVGEVLSRIEGKLREAGARLPAPPVKGTIESAVVTGLSIALAVVEAEAPPPSAPVGVEE